MGITTKRQALERQERDVFEQQEKHGALDVAALVRAQSNPQNIEDGRTYDESDLRRSIPWGFQITDMIVAAYEGDTAGQHGPSSQDAEQPAE